MIQTPLRASALPETRTDTHPHYNLRSDVANTEIGPCSVLGSLLFLTERHDLESNGFVMACFSVITPDFCFFLYNSVPI